MDMGPGGDRESQEEGLDSRLNAISEIKLNFGDEDVHIAFLELKSGRFEERELAKHIKKAYRKLKQNPKHGAAIPQSLWPKEYAIRFGIDNLRKCNMPRGWRLIYALKGSRIEIMSVILEWLPHHEYERRFGNGRH
jgi:hypothetical protein